MASITNEVRVCDCCAQKIANDDTSSCKNYYGHTHEPAAELGPGAFVVDDESPTEWWGRMPWYCDGCGDLMYRGSNRWTVYQLA
ncbi:hypothetical protein GCM10028801_31180 [Nocardioides maradonensis]